MHRFQAIGFGDRRPPQLIVGTAGIVLSHVQPAPPSPDDKRPILVPKLDGIDAAVVGLMDHGAMVLEPGKDGAWTGAMVSETGRVLRDLRFELAAAEPQPVSMPIAVRRRARRRSACWRSA